MMWKKPKGMHYTDMCIWIDENVPRFAENPGVFEKEENLMYNYLWLLVKALAIKRRMFQNFSDYDGYAFHSANRLFFALTKNWRNQGKLVKGRIIKPIKSCLNYTKALLYPMKIEYQNNTFRQVLSQTLVNKKFDSFAYKEKLVDELRSSNYSKQIYYLEKTLQDFDKIIDSVLEKSHFKKGTSVYNNIKISILLSTKNIYEKKSKLVDFQNTSGIILWRLPKSLSSYVKDLTNALFLEIRQIIIDCFNFDRVEDSLLEKMIANPEGIYDEESY